MPVFCSNMGCHIFDSGLLISSKTIIFIFICGRLHRKKFRICTKSANLCPLILFSKVHYGGGGWGGGQNRLNNFAQFCLGRGCKTDLQENGPSSLGVGPKAAKCSTPSTTPVPHPSPPPPPHTHNGMSEFAKSICSRIVLIVDSVTFLRQLVQNVKSKCLQLK